MPRMSAPRELPEGITPSFAHQPFWQLFEVHARYAGESWRVSTSSHHPREVLERWCQLVTSGVEACFFETNRAGKPSNIQYFEPHHVG